MRTQLTGALTAQFDRELERSVRRIEDAIAPYVQFVDGERTSLADKRAELATVQARLSALKSSVDAS